MKSPFEFARAVPDDSPLFQGVPEGSCPCIDGILYVPQSRWLKLLADVLRLRSGDEAADKFIADNTR